MTFSITSRADKGLHPLFGMEEFCEIARESLPIFCAMQRITSE
jgi:hypothetical protein